MQSKLFNDPNLGNSTHSPGAARKLLAEKKYQANKSECQKLQRQWQKGQADRLSDREKRTAQVNELRTAAPQTIVLVACAAQKLETAAPARDLYCSAWFRKARKYAERFGEKWFILSSLHGLLDPDRVIEPYEQTLNNSRKPERNAWAVKVVRELNSKVPPGSTIIILAGSLYRENLVQLLSGRFCLEIPMQGLGIGEQLQFLAKAVNDENKTDSN